MSNHEDIAMGSHGTDVTADPRETILFMMDLSAGRLSFHEFAAWVVAKSGPSRT